MSLQPHNDEASKGEVKSSTPSAPVLCVAGCGFYGNPKTNDYCSLCWKKHGDEIEKSDSEKPAETDKSVAGEGSAESNLPKQTDTSRCWREDCRKKVGILGIPCKCGYTFCGKHRYPEEHNCGFDFKNLAATQLAKANPVVKNSKGLDRLESL